MFNKFIITRKKIKNWSMSNNGKNSSPSLVSNRSLMDNSSRPVHSISLLVRNCNEKTKCHGHTIDGLNLSSTTMPMLGARITRAGTREVRGDRNS